MRLHACVLVLLLVGSSVAIGADREAYLVAMRPLVPADEIGGYEAFHLAVTLAVGPNHPWKGLRDIKDIQDVKEEQEHFGSGGDFAYGHAVADWVALARNGDVGAMSNLGVMHALGLGVAPDPALAVELYRAAAHRGSAVAQNNLGIAYFLGRGVERDKSQAVQWLGAAERQGLSLAENTLGVWNLLGGHERPGAIRLARAVARRGSFDAARLNLARLYEANADDPGFDEWFWNTAVAETKGWPPVPAEPLAAYNWFDRAADADFPAAARKRDLAEAAERASTARWSLPLFSPSEHVLKEKELVERRRGGWCRVYESSGESGNLISKESILRLLMRSAEKRLGVPFERAYMYLKCHKLGLGDTDLLRVTAESPMESNGVAKEVLHYFADELQDKFLLGKILMCRRDFGHGCVNLFEHIEVNKKAAAGYPEKVKALNVFERQLRRAVDNEHLGRHVGLCRRFLNEPEHCGN